MAPTECPLSACLLNSLPDCLTAFLFACLPACPRTHARTHKQHLDSLGSCRSQKHKFFTLSTLKLVGSQKTFLVCLMRLISDTPSHRVYKLIFHAITIICCRLKVSLNFVISNLMSGILDKEWKES